MKSRFEKLIEHIINEDMEKANELFHQAVVEKSREIYNELVSEDYDMDEGEDDNMSMDATDDMMGDISADEEGMDMDDDTADMDMGDEEDMDVGDEEDMDMGDEEDMGGEGDLEDRVVNIEDALEDLKAEFDRLMSDEEGEPEHTDMPEEGVMREYVEKVKDFYKGDNAEGQGVGAGSIGGSTNTKSSVAGKNDMGGTAKNIAQGGDNAAPDGNAAYKKPSNLYTKSEGKLPGAGSFENVPGAKAGKAFSNAKKPVTSEPSGVNKNSTID